MLMKNISNVADFSGRALFILGSNFYALRFICEKVANGLIRN